MKTLLLIFILLLSSCTIMGSLEGLQDTPEQNAYLRLGAPMYKTFDGNGGHIDVWCSIGQAPDLGGSVMPVQYYTYTDVYVNSQGIIYYWRIDKQEIPPQQYQITLTIKN